MLVDHYVRLITLSSIDLDSYCLVSANFGIDTSTSC